MAAVTFWMLRVHARRWRRCWQQAQASRRCGHAAQKASAYAACAEPRIMPFIAWILLNLWAAVLLVAAADVLSLG